MTGLEQPGLWNDVLHISGCTSCSNPSLEAPRNKGPERGIVIPISKAQRTDKLWLTGGRPGLKMCFLVAVTYCDQSLTKLYGDRLSTNGLGTGFDCDTNMAVGPWRKQLLASLGSVPITDER